MGQKVVAIFSGRFETCGCSKSSEYRTITLQPRHVPKKPMKAIQAGERYRVCVTSSTDSFLLPTWSSRRPSRASYHNDHRAVCRRLLGSQLTRLYTFLFIPPRPFPLQTKALADGEFRMYESAAINTYLGDKYSGREGHKDLIPPPGTRPLRTGAPPHHRRLFSSLSKHIHTF